MSQRNGVIGVAKFVFSVVIVLCHSSALIPEQGNIMNGGYLAVEFFFIVSGYLMAQSAHKEKAFDVNTIGSETLHFAWRKIQNVFWYYVIGFVLNFCVLQYLNQHTKNFRYSLLTFLRIGTAAGLDNDDILGGAWYISAMILAMLFIYPIYRYRENIFTNIAAPLISIFAYGYLFQNYGKVATLDWLGVGRAGLLRAFAGISLGCISYAISKKIMISQDVKKYRNVLTTIEILGYLISLLYMQMMPYGFCNDFIIIGVMTISISISFSGRSFLNNIFANVSVFWPEYSLALYMGHYAIRPLFMESKCFVSNAEKLLIYILSSLLISLLLRFFGNYLKTFFDRGKIKAASK